MKSFILTLKTLTLLVMAFCFGAYVAVAAGIPAHATLFGSSMAVLSFIPWKSLNFNSSFLTITATDVLSEWGAVFRAEGQSVKDILIKLRQRSVTAGYFPTRITDKTIMEKVTAEFARVLQRFQKAWTPVGGTTFKPVKIPLYKLKIDLQETPDDLEESWLGFLADNNLDRRKWPFITWYLTQAIIQAEKDLELNEIYTGIPGTITPGTATAAGTSLKGIKKQINEFDAAGKLMKIVMGAVPTDPEEYVEYVEEMVKQIPRLLRNELDFVFVEEDGHDLFRDGMRLKYNANYNQVEDTKITKLRNENIRIVGLPSMAGSTKIWTTPSWNRQGGYKKPSNATVFEVEKVDRTVKAYTDFYKGYGFWIPEYVASNDVELV